MIKPILATACAVLLLAACDSREPAQTFTFTAIPDQDESRLEQRFGKVAEHLEEALGVPVKYVPVKSYPAAVTAFRNDEVQMAWFGGLSGVQARRLVPGSRAIAQGQEDTAFKSYFIANSSTGLEPGDSLPDAFAEQPSFTFGSKGSTSGRLMPEYYFRERFGAPPQELIDKVGFSGDHSRTLSLVESGAYATGALNYQVWDQALADGDIDTDKVQVIWETPPTRTTTGPCAATWTSASATASASVSPRCCWRSTTRSCWKPSRAAPSCPPTTMTTRPSKTPPKASGCWIEPL